ncbi:hypothetical protein CHS0354_020190 [Potamilus streckersoni]|uniref:Dr1-associated corepressor n=1 Tax=Potamilus streckersoni TaxID=2493646 RepID=A0AAE0VXB8_9BIVA|nr:hypothetical protein CHS0354_020190 [Potamilus streckersoni]
MPSKKKKFNSRFPPARIKKIMQTDDDVGKVATAVPVIISRALELFIESLILKTNEITQAKNAKTLSCTHIKQTIHSEKKFDFLRDLVANVPDHQPEEDGENSTINSSDFKKIKVGRPRKPREPGAGPGRPRKKKSNTSSEECDNDDDDEEEDDDDDGDDDEETESEDETNRPEESQPKPPPQFQPQPSVSSVHPPPMGAHHYPQAIMATTQGFVPPPQGFGSPHQEFVPQPPPGFGINFMNMCASSMSMGANSNNIGSQRLAVPPGFVQGASVPPVSFAAFSSFMSSANKQNEDEDYDT